MFLILVKVTKRGENILFSSILYTIAIARMYKYVLIRPKYISCMPFLDNKSKGVAKAISF